MEDKVRETERHEMKPIDSPTLFIHSYISYFATEFYSLFFSYEFLILRLYGRLYGLKKVTLCGNCILF